MNIKMEKYQVEQNFALGLGSNLGDSELIIKEAITLLQREGVTQIVCADSIKTEAENCVEGTPDFTNTALIGCWEGTPQTLLKCCQEIEVKLGRPTQHAQNESRTIDLDILLFEDKTISTSDLTIPHARMHERRFVLQPLCQIAPNWVIPKRGSVQSNLDKLK
jgi:2-amino-4-hydroxy-6-hydroxymethyldihydropteridine diphosphokinase